MADFKTALTKGLSAALEVERRRDEVTQIFTELDKQVYEVTNGKVTIAIAPHGLDIRLAAAIQNKISPKFGIIASSTNDNTRKRTLSNWEQANEGYPCTLTIGKNIFSCEDKYSLENCLTELLQDSEVGEKIHALMQPDAV